MNDRVRAQVSDTGCGIPKDKLNEIFKPLSTSKEEGTGLGLSVSQDIIEVHDGTIDVSSKPGDEVTFTMTLPVENHPEDPAEIDEA
jgi:signal transduction histidine kinase